ncbi:hypothetical protein GIB67_012770 [Kingdonia uniflora]|uniref:Uncharacterized protein n=1 Tax=Kingdonia uniflora TaxID=39325 RepID=A0A7J7NFN4_9MAGN|nr:hypothetical protein GIB67_012770 [Kingdonia uniflora]
MLLLDSFCIIEGPETVQDFVQMQMNEIQGNIRSRRNKIFLLMEEVRRLRVQQRIKNAKAMDETSDEASEMPEIPSSIPFLPHMTPTTLRQLYLTSFSFISGIIIFGGLVAPIVSSSFMYILDRSSLYMRVSVMLNPYPFTVENIKNTTVKAIVIEGKYLKSDKKDDKSKSGYKCNWKNEYKGESKGEGSLSKGNYCSHCKANGRISDKC